MTNLKQKLKNGYSTIGSWITLGHSGIAEIMAKAGFDWLVVDLEHSTISIETAGELIRTIDLCGVAPLVRLTSNDADQIKRVMDGGAHGIIVPMVNSRNDAERAVAAVRYAPKGNRGVGLARAQGYGTKFREYFQWQLENSVVIVQIEHRDAIPNLKEIFTTEGVDGFIIGPYDLTCSMAIPGEFEHRDFIEVMGEIRRMGAELGLPGGLHVVEPDTERLKACLNEGYRFIAYSVDIRILDVGARVGGSSFKEHLTSAN